MSSPGVLYLLNPEIPAMIPVIFENEDILAIDKPVGISSIPERDIEKECVLSILSKTIPQKLYVVHRLDKETSGILVFAKNPQTHRFVNDQFSSRNIKKIYIAVTDGIITERKGVIQKPLRLCGSGRMKVDLIHGKPSITEYEVEKYADSHTLVRIYPLTGRRHQIRVHLYSIGHPILGDPLYGHIDKQKQFPRMMLHAAWIEITLPKGKPLTLASPLPPSFGF